MNATEICKGIFHIEDSYRVYCTFVSGQSRCILWDTGFGRSPLRPWVESHASLPYTVLISHGHRDHTGGIDSFEKAYLSKADWPMLGTEPKANVFDLKAGRAFDLGDETALVVSLAGHTPGSCGLLLNRRRLLLAGDALNPRLQLLGNEACSLETLRRTIEYAIGLPFDCYLNSHAPTLLGKKQLETHLKHLDAFDPKRLVENRRRDEISWSSLYKQEGTLSEFILGESLHKRIMG